MDRTEKATSYYIASVRMDSTEKATSYYIASVKKPAHASFEQVVECSLTLEQEVSYVLHSEKSLFRQEPYSTTLLFGSKGCAMQYSSGWPYFF